MMDMSGSPMKKGYDSLEHLLKPKEEPTRLFINSILINPCKFLRSPLFHVTDEGIKVLISQYLNQDLNPGCPTPSLGCFHPIMLLSNNNETCLMHSKVWK